MRVFVQEWLSALLGSFRSNRDEQSQKGNQKKNPKRFVDSNQEFFGWETKALLDRALLAHYSNLEEQVNF